MKLGHKKVIYFIRYIQDVMSRWLNTKLNYITVVDTNKNRILCISVIKDKKYKDKSRNEGSLSFLKIQNILNLIFIQSRKIYL